VEEEAEEVEEEVGQVAVVASALLHRMMEAGEVHQVQEDRLVREVHHHLDRAKTGR